MTTASIPDYSPLVIIFVEVDMKKVFIIGSDSRSKAMRFETANSVLQKDSFGEQLRKDLKLGLLGRITDFDLILRSFCLGLSIMLL